MNALNDALARIEERIWDINRENVAMMKAGYFGPKLSRLHGERVGLAAARRILLEVDAGQPMTAIRDMVEQVAAEELFNAVATHGSTFLEVGDGDEPQNRNTFTMGDGAYLFAVTVERLDGTP